MPSLSSAKRLWCISHRGGKCAYSENTLGAFQHSLDLGVDAIEIDVWQIDDQLLVTHDRRLGKLIPGVGRLQDHSAEHLRSLRLACGSQIPTLQEVLALVGNQAELNIELKDPTCSQRVCEVLESFVVDHQGSFDQYLFSSFNHPQLRECQQRLPDVRRGVLVEGVPIDYAATATALNAYSFHPGLNFLTQPLIDDAHQRGLKVCVYTVNEWDDLAMMQAMRVDGVFTDYPERVIELNHRR